MENVKHHKRNMESHGLCKLSVFLGWCWSDTVFAFKLLAFTGFSPEIGLYLCGDTPIYAENDLRGYLAVGLNI